MKLTMLPFGDRDFKVAKEIAALRNRRDDNRVYTSTSTIIGLEYLSRFNGDTNKFTIIKTEELGFLVIQDLEDLGARDEMEMKFPYLIID